MAESKCETKDGHYEMQIDVLDAQALAAKPGVQLPDYLLHVDRNAPKIFPHSPMSIGHFSLQGIPEFVDSRDEFGDRLFLNGALVKHMQEDKEFKRDPCVQRVLRLRPLRIGNWSNFLSLRQTKTAEFQQLSQQSGLGLPSGETDPVRRTFEWQPTIRFFRMCEQELFAPGPLGPYRCKGWLIPVDSSWAPRFFLGRASSAAIHWMLRGVDGDRITLQDAWLELRDDKMYRDDFLELRNYWANVVGKAEYDGDFKLIINLEALFNYHTRQRQSVYDEMEAGRARRVEEWERKMAVRANEHIVPFLDQVLQDVRKVDKATAVGLMVEATTGNPNVNVQELITVWRTHNQLNELWKFYDQIAWFTLAALTDVRIEDASEIFDRRAVEAREVLVQLLLRHVHKWPERIWFYCAETFDEQAFQKYQRVLAGSLQFYRFRDNNKGSYYSPDVTPQLKLWRLEELPSAILSVHPVLAKTATLQYFQEWAREHHASAVGPAKKKQDRGDATSEALERIAAAKKKLSPALVKMISSFLAGRVRTA